MVRWVRNNRPSQPQQQQSGGQNISPSTVQDILNKFLGGESTSTTSNTSSGGMFTTEGGGLSGAGYAGIIAAAIAAQHGLSNDNDRIFEGNKTGDAFNGNFGNEPWLSWLSWKLGNNATPGERFDAAVKDGDWNKAHGRSFGMADYWADPGRGIVGELVEGAAGEDARNFLDPIQYLFKKWGG